MMELELSRSTDNALPNYKFALFKTNKSLYFEQIQVNFYFITNIMPISNITFLLFINVDQYKISINRIHLLIGIVFHIKFNLQSVEI